MGSQKRNSGAINSRPNLANPHPISERALARAVSQARGAAAGGPLACTNPDQEIRFTRLVDALQGIKASAQLCSCEQVWPLAVPCVMTRRRELIIKT
jgi:hypothetical protein